MSVAARVTLVAGLLEAFFTERLQQQRNASPNTIATYRDTFRLLLAFAQERLRKPPSALPLADLDAPFVAAFLQHLEKQRRNSMRTRNARLAAIHSFFRYVALQEPAHSATCQRVLAIPTKKFERTLVTSLTRAEQEALLAALDRTTWLGRRDHAIMILLLQTGLRVSELRDLRCEDIVLTVEAHVRCRGKGRTERCTPLTREAVSVIKTSQRRSASSGRRSRISRSSRASASRRPSRGSAAGRRLSPRPFFRQRRAAVGRRV